MDYPPNVEAVRWFARDILPIVRQRHPGAADAVAVFHGHAGEHVYYFKQIVSQDATGGSGGDGGYRHGTRFAVEDRHLTEKFSFTQLGQQVFTVVYFHFT